MKVSAIVPAAGASRRMGGGLEKPYRLLGRKPLLAHSLSALEQTPWVNEIILLVARRRLPKARRMLKRYRFRKVRGVYPGGKTRAQSVYRGLLRTDSRADFVLVHDGARPLLRSSLLRRVMTQARRTGAAIPALPVAPTIKQVTTGNIVVKTLNRKGLWEAQTPQLFRRTLLFEAFRQAGRHFEKVTDCAALVERTGHRVKVVMGDPMNIKVTTPMDLVIAEALLKKDAVRNRI